MPGVLMPYYHPWLGRMSRHVRGTYALLLPLASEDGSIYQGVLMHYYRPWLTRMDRDVRGTDALLPPLVCEDESTC